jgi:hypothetical protein
MLETILKNFASPKVAETRPPERCKKCESEKFWKPKNFDGWKCYGCQPPPIPAMVEKIAEWRDEEKKPTSEIVTLEEIREWAAIFPACRKCLCRAIRERVYSDGTSKYECWTCKGPVTLETFPELDKWSRRDADRERDTEAG